MKRIVILLLPALTLTAVRTRAMDISVSDSIITLATNITRNYTFTDPTNGLGVVVAVTVSPFSSVTNNPSFSLLDFDGDNPTRLGVDSGTGGGDGNWMDVIEGADFTASLLSVSNGIITNSVRFGIAGIGVRPEGGPILWTSSATTNSFQPDEEGLVALDTGTARIAGSAYTATLRIAPGDNRVQLSDHGALSGQSFVVTATFIEGTGEPVVTLNPSDQVVCEGVDAFFLADAVGDPLPSVQWQVQTNGGSSFLVISNATNSTLLIVGPAQSDSGSVYRAVFSNALGVATSTAALLSVVDAPSPLITPGSTNVQPLSATNTASADPGAAGYAWSISNGTIIGSTTSQSISYQAGLSGSVTIGLAVSNEFGCADNSSVTVAIAPLSGVTGGAGVYASDDGNFIVKYGTNGVGSLFAIENLNGAGAMAFNRGGTLFVANYGDGTIVKFDTNGVGTLFIDGLFEPYGLAFDGDGNLYISDYIDNKVWKYDTNGVGVHFVNTGLDGPAGLAFDREGNLYVANSASGEITRYATNGVGSLFADGLGAPYGLAFDSTGNLFVAESEAGMIEKFAPDGSGSIFAIGLNEPIGLAFDSAGDLYVSDWPSSIWKYAPDGSAALFATSGLSSVEFVAVWPIPRQLIPANPATFSAPAIMNGQLQFAVGGSVGADYVTQAATNLFVPDWISLSTNTAPFQFADTNAAAFNQRFYRAVDAR